MRSVILNKWLTFFVTILALTVLTPKTGQAGPVLCSQLLTSTHSDLLQKKLQFYNPFNLLHGRSVDAVELLGQNFYAPSEKGSIIGISGYSGIRAKMNRANGDFLTGKPFADGEHVFHFDVEKPSDLADVLMLAYNKSGPIYRLAIMGHGAPGFIELGSGKLTHKTKFPELPDDLFVKDAEIVILSCNCAQGNIINPDGGINKIKAIFSKFVKNGAKIIASRQAVSASTRGFDKTETVIEAREESGAKQNGPLAKALIVPMALVFIPTMWADNVVNMVWLDTKSKFDPIVVIDLPPVNQTE